VRLRFQSGGIGDPCVPEDEYQQYFSGYEATEVNIESKSFQCETRLCLVNHFNGRVSCPYGQTLPEATGMIKPEETALPHPWYLRPRDPHQGRRQQAVRPAPRRDTVYCSCRCAGTDSNARYCKCPTGFQCSKLLDPIDRLGAKELAGSYCIKNGTEYSAANPNVGLPCLINRADAMPPDPPGNCGLYNGQ